MAFLATHAPWVRPPLSADLRGWEISLSAAADDEPARTLREPRSIHGDSPGVIVLLVLLPTAALALRDPRYTGFLGGTVLCATIATHAMLFAYHPGLLECLERQHAQRAEIVTVLDQATAGEAVASAQNGRVSGAIVPLEQRPRFSSAWRFVLYGTWLVPLSAALVLFGTKGTLAGRVMKLVAWVLIAGLLSISLCWSRFHAEWHWQRAWQLTRQADYHEARVHLARGLKQCPPMRDLQRTWYLAGKLDYHCQRDTVQYKFYRAFQLARQDALVDAGELLVPYLARPAPPPAIRNLAAAIWTRLGRLRFLDGASQQALDQPISPSASAACMAWQQALAVDPQRTDCLLYLALSRARNRSGTDDVEGLVQLLLRQISDRTLRADLLATLGDVYFEAGELEAARRYYSASKRQFELPKDMNFRARRGLLGT